MTDTTFSFSEVAPPPSRSLDLPGPALTSSPAEAVSPSAKDRLEASRTQMRDALKANVQPPAPANGLAIGHTVTALLRGVPGVELVVKTAKSWWRGHRDTAQTIGQASQSLIRPVAQRHPVSFLGGAVAAGVVLALHKPWRFLLRRQVVFGAASLIVAQALKRRSLASWLQMAAKLAGARMKTRSGLATPFARRRWCRRRSTSEAG